MLKKYKVQTHQLTPNAMVALSKYVWETTTLCGAASIEVFAKHYCLHWQKRFVGGVVDSYESYTFT